MRSNYSDEVSNEYMMIVTSIIISFHVSLYLLLNVFFLVVTDDLYSNYFKPLLRLFVRWTKTNYSVEGLIE